MGAFAGIAMSVASAAMQAKQQRQAASLQNDAVSAEMQQRQQQQQLARQIDKQRRDQALKEAKAASIARMGARGGSSLEGSGRAVLRGLIDRVAEDQSLSDKQDELGLERMRMAGQMNYRRSLLEASDRRNRAALGLFGQGFDLMKRISQ